MEGRFPIAVLVSGGGSNLQAIIDAAKDPDYPAIVVVVISDKPGVGALARAEAAGIPTVVVEWHDRAGRDERTRAVCDVAAEHGASAMVLAGFMRILAPVAMERYPGAILNIHPALLPAFPGMHAVAQALDHGVKVTGVTVHFVDELVDHGPIVSQEPVLVFGDDTEATLHARIRRVEHSLYPAAVEALARGDLTVRGRTVVWGTP